MDADKYSMQCFPTSFLSATPSGKMQDVQDLMALGFLGKDDAMKLLDMPDLREFYNFNNAGVEDIQRQIEKMIDDGTYETPEPYQNLELGIVKMQQAYLRYRADNAPDSRLELFRRWIEDARALMQKATQDLEAQALAAQGQAEAQAADEQMLLDAPVPDTMVDPMAEQAMMDESMLAEQAMVDEAALVDPNQIVQ
jgi:hypothetical protein